MVADPVAGALLILGLIAVVLAGRLTEFTGWEIRFQALLVSSCHDYNHYYKYMGFSSELIAKAPRFWKPVQAARYTKA